jgi:hypothetical protein
MTSKTSEGYYCDDQDIRIALVLPVLIGTDAWLNLLITEGTVVHPTLTFLSPAMTGTASRSGIEPRIESRRPFLMA